MTLKQTIITTLIIAIIWLIFAWTIDITVIQKKWPPNIKQLAAILQ